MPTTEEIVRNHPHLVRDAASKAIINKNQGEYHRRQHLKKKVQQKEAEIKALKDDVALLKTQVAALIAKVNPSS